MSLSSLPVAGLLVAVALFIIVRQFQDRPLRLLLLLGAPLGLMLLGGRALFAGHRSTTLIALLVADLALAAGFGAWRGWTFRVWRGAAGEARRQGTRATLVLWLVSLLARGGVAVAERAAGASRNASLTELPAALGVTLLAQGAVLLWRANGTS